MKLNKPKFWDKEKTSFFSILLSPFILITLTIIFLKKIFSVSKKFNIPIICVGNIYLGGTGKTPTSIYLANELKKLGFKTAIVRKYYKDHRDEHNQIKHNFTDLVLNKNRKLAIKEAEKNGHNIVILDDGLQDYNIKKNLSIACFNQNQLVGNGQLLPSGPLRENLGALKNINIILINGGKVPKFEEKLLKINKNLEIYYSSYKPLNIDRFKNHNLLAVAGIANPENFFMLLEKNNLNIKEKLTYPDHDRFTKNQIQNIIENAKRKKLKIVMTEKDFFKIDEFKLKDIDYLKVTLEIENKEGLLNKIKEHI